MTKFLQAIRSAYAWCKTNLGWLMLMLIGATTGAALLRAKNNQINTLKAAREVEKAKSDIKALEVKRDAISARDMEAADEVIKLSAKIAEKQKDIAALHQGVKPWNDLSDEQVRAALKDAGL